MAGPTLAVSYLKQGLMDEISIWYISVGATTPAGRCRHQEPKVIGERLSIPTVLPSTRYSPGSFSANLG
ncbi:hypothetical protein [Chelativorans salis]|uniref:Uncharacterized protein n=1 Tax=Chelativorans salis TaxID=2978478 RepID=A0ABT2LHF7_9HYPH|nr:hypothetical protein [Chelativorans sp. EGI FJ00035]MCT7373757.1 hypothetical protein [Chelativorans sp. EGI FJ00035]